MLTKILELLKKKLLSVKSKIRWLGLVVVINLFSITCGGGDNSGTGILTPVIPKPVGGGTPLTSFKLDIERISALTGKDNKKKVTVIPAPVIEPAGAKFKFSLSLDETLIVADEGGGFLSFLGFGDQVAAVSKEQKILILEKVVQIDEDTGAITINYERLNGDELELYQNLKSGSYSFTVKAEGVDGYSGTVSDKILIILSPVPTDLDGVDYAKAAKTVKNIDGTNMTLLATTDPAEGTAIWTISPDLPRGLSINSNTGTISGTPTEAIGETTYMITATGNGAYTGNATKEIELNINLPIKSVTYNPTNIIAGLNQLISITPTVDPEGARAHFIISKGYSNNLPAGLEFSTNTGRIWGTPTILSNKIELTIWTTGQGGSAYRKDITNTNTITIQVTSKGITSFAYTNEDVNGVKNGYLITNVGSVLNMIPVIEPTGATATYEITPAELPAGLSFDSSTGRISGEATEARLNNTNFTVRAIGTGSYGGILEDKIGIAIREDLTGISYSRSEIVGGVGNPIEANEVTLDPKDATVKYKIDPSIPDGSGFLFSTTTGAITGTPSPENVHTNVSNYTITATATGYYHGEKTAQVSIKVEKGLRSVVYKSNVIKFNPGVETTWIILPTLLPEEATVVYAVDPKLPEGLVIDSGTGKISGKPLYGEFDKEYTVTATGTGSYAGSVTTTVNIEVRRTFRGLEYTNINAGKNEAIKDAKPVLDPENATAEYTITPDALVDGLTFDESSGIISGTPTKKSNATTYTISATATGDYYGVNKTTTITIEVGDALDNLYYTNSDGNAIDIPINPGVAMTPINPKLLPDGATATYEISPNLPEGLRIIEGTGVIEGTTSTPTAKVQYTITAKGNGDYAGTKIATIHLKVNQTFNGISYSATELRAAANEEITGFTPTLDPTTAQVSSYTINPPIPVADGLSFDQVTGEIGGTPNKQLDSKSYEITAIGDTNNGYYGTHKTTVTITVKGALGSVTYTDSDNNPIDIALNPGVAIKPIYPTLLPNGSTATYQISPNLPEGLRIIEGTGVIEGTTSTPTAKIQYTITATGSGDYTGVKTATINLQVNQLFNRISYANANIEGKKDTLITPSSPTLDPTDTVVSSYKIAPLFQNGLKFNTSTGQIFGTPDKPSSSTVHTITAIADTNQGFYGTNTTTVTVRVIGGILVSVTYYHNNNPNKPLGIAGEGDDRYIYLNVKDSISPAHQPVLKPDGATATYSISPTLPSGLSIHEKTGIISGSPDIILSAPDIDEKIYTITAKGADVHGGTVSTNITILIDRKLKLHYMRVHTGQNAPVNIPPVINNSHDEEIPNANKQFTYEFQPTSTANQLPSGITLDPSTGIISGSHSGVLSNSYRIRATGNGDYLGVVLYEEFSYATHKTRNITGFTTMTDLSHKVNTPFQQGDNLPKDLKPILKYGLSATADFEATGLPPGLTMDTTGKITGTPTQTGRYTVTITARGTGYYFGDIYPHPTKTVINITD